MVLFNSTAVLGPYNIQSNSITVSGISSGAYMANQIHISFSSRISGAALFAGGPFYCAESTISLAETLCMDGSGGGPQVSKLIDLSYTDEKLGDVDFLSNLRDDHVYIFSGKLDTVVEPSVVKALEKYYEAFVPVGSIIADYSLAAEHCMPSLDYTKGEECDLLSTPYIGYCQFDGAGEALKVLYDFDAVAARKAGDAAATSSLAPRVTDAALLAANLFSFDQTPFIPLDYAIGSSLGKLGYIYVPSACQAKGAQCRLHVSFHGCEQTLSQIGPLYAQHSGYNEWAESNGIIVVYPYAEVSTVLPTNPKGCWDWWAYTDYRYGIKTGAQMRFVKNIIAAVTGQPFN